MYAPAHVTTPSVNDDTVCAKQQPTTTLLKHLTPILELHSQQQNCVTIDMARSLKLAVFRTMYNTINPTNQNVEAIQSGANYLQQLRMYNVSGFFQK